MVDRHQRDAGEELSCLLEQLEPKGEAAQLDAQEAAGDVLLVEAIERVRDGGGIGLPEQDATERARV